MSMVFWTGFNLGDFLIEGLTVNTAASFTMVAVFSFLMAVAVEGMKIVLAKIEGEYISNLLRNGVLSRSFCERDVLVSTSMASRAYQGLPLALLYSFHLLMAYIVMLVVMQFNTYLFVAIILGSMCGYFFFSVILTRVRLYYLYLNSQHVNHLRKQMDQTEGTTPPMVTSAGMSSAANIYTCKSELAPSNSPQDMQLRDSSSDDSYDSPTKLSATTTLSESKNSGRGLKKCCVKSKDETVGDNDEHCIVKESTPLMLRKEQSTEILETTDKKCCKTKSDNTQDMEVDVVQTQPSCCSEKST